MHQESCRDDGAGHDEPDETPAVPMDIETKVCRQGDQTRLFVSADDIMRVVERIATNLERIDTEDTAVEAQLQLLRELAGALLAAIATANTE